MASELDLQDVSVNYGDFTAVDQVSLQLEQGQIGCLLGPSGCGKTSLLRAIAGFEPVASGAITLHDKLLSAKGFTLPPEQRRVGMVFQDFALFPHLDIARNIGFGLHSLDRTRRHARVQELLELVGLADSAGAYPHELSGGQQQRVALARALAPQPDIILLDEPFSSLDSELRVQLAGEVRGLLKRNRVTAILVTHDQFEAFAMADTVTILQSGRVAQTDTPYNLYHLPANEFVAGFIGQGSVITVRVDEQGQLDNGLGRPWGLPENCRPGQELKLLIRPDDVQIAPDSPLELEVIGKSFRGAEYLYELALADGQRILCLTPSHVDVVPGYRLPVRFELHHVVMFDSES